MAMLHSIATVSVSGTLDEKLDAIAAAGFAGVEIFENDLLASPMSAAEVGAMIRDKGLKCTAFQPFRDFEGMPDDIRVRTFDRLERKFDVMAALGTDVLLVCSNVSPQSLGDHARIAADLREAGERAAPRGIHIGYEALAWGRHVNDHRDAWALVQAADHPNTGLILDSFHSLARDIPIVSLLTIDPAKIVLVQVADAPRLDMEKLFWSRHFRTMPGQGDLPVVDWVEALVKIGYDGPLSLEIFNDRFRAGSSRQVALDGKRSLVLVDDTIARRSGTPVLPPPVPVGEIAFLEFAADETEAAQLAALFETLGFVRVGQHKRKSVSHWRQGDINLVINAEVEGFARSYDVVHGASVCAIGVAVPDGQAALARADGFAIEAFAQEVAEDEFRIPAVRGVGGSLLYLVDAAKLDAIWAGEFVPVADAGAGAAAAGAGLSRIDHIAQSMGYEEMLSWLLFYVALFAVTKTPQLEIADPLGLVQSQAVEGPERRLRITMNGSAGQQTLSSRFLQSYFGAGVQHVAFASGDIFASADAMAQRGAEILAIPDNYYDDLDARFGLGAETIARLRRSNILYDRDGKAEYFQFYTRAFAKRFFFEVVERREYEGYGAPNAAIRLAAQARYKSGGID
jgi:4-hydroxyphenylpyruvate dioxygenase